MKQQLPIYIATIAAVALGAPAIQAADTQSGIIVAQATSPGDPSHPGSTPSFMPKDQSAQAQPAAKPATPAPQRKHSAASTGKQRHAAQSPQRRHEPSTTGSSSSHK
jgi:hypothetical protein